jgi:hypothetical protein
MAQVLHASKSGYFPSCLPSFSSGYPSFPLETAMEIYWKVQSWQVTGTYTYGPYTVPISQTFTSTLSDETGLVCLASYSSSDFAPDEEVANTGRTFFQRPLNFAIIGGEYAVLIDFCIAFQDPAFPDSRSVGTIFAGEGIGSTFAFFGKSLPCSIEVKDGDEFVPSASISIEPAAYWTYSP